MCGIAAYAGPKPAYPFIIESLKRMEYRGYDSYGFAVWKPDGMPVRCQGLKRPSQHNWISEVEGHVGVGHTRWATHGKVSYDNTHPIRGGKPGSPPWFIVHNGVIENHAELRKELELKGYTFTTQTDTESIAHLLAETYTSGGLNLLKTVRHVCLKLKGQYAFAALSPYNVDEVVLACNGSPLLLTAEGYVASDVKAFVGLAKTAYVMTDGQMAILTFNGQNTYFRIFDQNYVKSRLVDLKRVSVPDAIDTDLGEHAHYMHKEICEQPAVVRQTWMSALLQSVPKRIVLFGCGSSYHAALLGRRYIESFVEIPCTVEYATDLATEWLSEEPGTMYLGITQSGETKDTLIALDRVVGNEDVQVMTANANSAAARMAKTVIPLDCGTEYGVAATKTFTAQAMRLLDLAVIMGHYSILGWAEAKEGLAKAIEEVIKREDEIKDLALYVSGWHNILYLARGLLYPIAKEGALKMKEVAYKHAEAMHAAEMKHGPIALIDDGTLSIFLLTSQDDAHVRRIVCNIEEVRARGGRVVVITDSFTATSLMIRGVDAKLFQVNVVSDYLQPILVNVVLQLLSYHVALYGGHDVDRPRNLAKSVTVE